MVLIMSNRLYGLRRQRFYRSSAMRHRNESSNQRWHKFYALYGGSYKVKRHYRNLY